MVRCISGAVFDVIVDLRKDSPTFKKYIFVNLKSGEGRAVLIGPHLGHAFLSLEENTTVSY